MPSPIQPYSVLTTCPSETHTSYLEQVGVYLGQELLVSPTRKDQLLWEDLYSVSCLLEGRS